jgi:hypothetical protein
MVPGLCVAYQRWSSVGIVPRLPLAAVQHGAA